MKTDKHNVEFRGSAVEKPHLDLLKRKTPPPGLDANELANDCLEQANFSAAAIHLVNTLAFHLKCNRVSIGMKSGNHTQLSALSNSASFDRKTNLIRHIEAVMDEAVDEASTIVFPNSDKSHTTIQAAHAQLVKNQGKREICTVPLRHHGDFIGAICMERTSGYEFETADLQQIESIAKLLGPLLYILYLEKRSIARRLIDSAHGFFINIFGANKAKSGAIGIALITAFLFLNLFPASYRITADAVMEGSIQRSIAAPVSGYIASANKRAGDSVNTGDLIASLDDKDLKLEAVELESQRQQLLREYRESLASNDRSKVSILNAKIKQIEAKQELISEQLSRLKLVATIDGVIIEGDLSQSIGSPVTRGDVLYKIAPAKDYRVILKVDESEITYIEPGQSGKLVLSASPGEKLDIIVSKITPVSISSDGRTYFRVEASLKNNNLNLQPGMEGVGKINVGERNLLWLVSHKVTDRLRLLLWHVWL